VKEVYYSADNLLCQVTRAEGLVAENPNTYDEEAENVQV
jgi:hypothetical protein